ncbi:MAG: putative DNA-binding domain-containing protein [Burkholderiales bacterium]|nr:putative DNA-binding domain-containing protein [Burkholderiales bacterium]
MTAAREGTSGASGSQLDFAAALLDPQLAVPRGLRAWNGSDPRARLAVYRNNVVSSLVDALAETFPVIQQLVGQEFFRAMAAIFVRQSPPRSQVLAHYGRDFPSFIAAFEPARALPYLADVARLEVARVAAYHAADADPVSDEVVSLALASGDRMGELQLVLHPSLSTLQSPFAVVTLWVAHQTEGGIEGGMAPVDVDAPESALVLRSGLDVLVLRAPEGAVAFVDALRLGLDLGEAAARAGAAAPAFDLTATLSPLLAHGVLTSLHLPPRLPA